MKPAAALLCSIAVCLTLDGAAFAADPRATQLKYQPWTKFCISSSCFVGIDARGQCVPSGGSVVIILEDGKPASISTNFGTKTGVQNPTSLRIDDGDPIPVPDQACLPSRLCINKLAADEALIARLKRAQKVTIEATDMKGERLSLSFSLADFARVYDGPGTEPKVFEESQASLKAKLLERGADSDPPPPCKD
jgi:invasion protein IalB